MIGGFQAMLAATRASIVPKAVEAFRTGDGIGWHEQHRRPVPRHRAVLPARVRRQPDPVRGSRPSTACEAKLRCRRQGGRRGLRPRRLDHRHGHGPPNSRFFGLRLPRCPPIATPRHSGGRGRGSGSGTSFEVARQGVRRRGLRHDLHLRRPARHGRSDPRRPPRGRSRHQPRTACGCSSSRSPTTLWPTTSTRWEALSTRYRLCSARRRRCRRRSVPPSGPRPARAAHPRGGHGGWIHPVPPGHRNALQPRVRGPAIAGPARPGPPPGPDRSRRDQLAPGSSGLGVAKVLAGIPARRRGSWRHSHHRAKRPPAPANLSPAAACSDPAEGRTPMRRT